MTLPYALWLMLIGVGVVGSISTFVGILVAFFKERRSDQLW
ncbi:hypothetical protein [Leucobacter chromiisoli]|nr:hypothetical protein [Leucobacter chromiisoli]